MTATDPVMYDPPSSLGADLYASTLADRTLHALVVHRMLASDQVHRMMSPGSTIDATYYRLGQLRRDGLAEAFGVRSGRRAQYKVWHATAAGVDRALSDPDLTRRYVVTRPKTSRNLVAHTLAVNEAGLAFISHARRNPGHECDYLAWEHEVAHSLGAERRGNPNLIADAVLSYTVADPAGRAATLARRFVRARPGDRTAASAVREAAPLRAVPRSPPNRRRSRALVEAALPDVPRPVPDHRRQPAQDLGPAHPSPAHHVRPGRRGPAHHLRSGSPSWPAGSRS